MNPVDIVLMNRNKGHMITMSRKTYGDSSGIPIEELVNPRDLDELRSLCDKLGYKLDDWVEYYWWASMTFLKFVFSILKR